MIKKYPDGSSYAVIGEARTKETIRVNSYEELWHLNQMIDAYNNLGIRPIITLPNLIDAQADRRFGDRESSGLKLVCRFLNSMHADFKIFHPHNPEVVEALMDNVEIIDNTAFISKVLIKLKKWDRPGDLILMSSDAGGFKPLMKLCNTIEWEGPTASAAKSREWKDGESVLTQMVDREDYKGKDILIIDDLCIGGGTFKGLSKLLRQRNCGKLYLAVSHMTIEKFKDDSLFKTFDHIFTTNSKFEHYYVPTLGGDVLGGYQPDNLEVIKIF